MTSKITRLEKCMLDRGFASSRMCAYKLRVSHQTVWNHVQARHFRAARVGRALFVEIKSVKEYYGREGARALGLGDWSDVFRTEAGEVHVKSAE